MDMAEPFSAVAPTLDSPVLSVLAGTTGPLGAREIARLTRRGSWEGVRKTLLRLAEHGLVTKQEVGNVTLYTLNRSHLAAPAVERLANLRGELFTRLSSAIARWVIAPVHASVFGSTARGDGDTTSDVDLLIVRPRSVRSSDPRWRAQIDELSSDLLIWTGNNAAVSEVGAHEVGRVAASATGQAIASEGVVLAGEPIRALARKTS